MPVLNHHIVNVRDSDASARFYVEILGFDAAVRLGEFAVLSVSADTTLDFLSTTADFDTQHYAFLVTVSEFDEFSSASTTDRCRIGQIPCTKNRGKPTTGTTAAVSTSTTRMVIDWKS
jgi:hypothetical protein